MNGERLQVNAPAGAADGTGTAELGRGRVHLTYANGSVRANVAFAAAHGGTLRVEAESRVDLSYPRVTHGIAPQRLPIQAKIRARHLDVAWLSQFNARLQTLSGKVDAKARLAGSIGDPQFVGDVHWLNGKLVATTEPTLGP
jgi:autotransporter translocation and assembly factor TamB